jgi:CheY-like chemotaxis protein
MSRILLADDSPHAQRMGERILREEGFEVVSLTDGNVAMLRLADVDPDVILADVFLPGKSGFDLCRYVKSEARFRHVRVVLTAGLLEPFDEDEARRAGCDAILKKPFEASKVLSTIAPLVKEAQSGRSSLADTLTMAPLIPLPVMEAPKLVEPPKSAEPPMASEPPPSPPPSPAPPPAPEIDPERVRAAVTLALDAALPAMIQEITERVLIALGH